MGFWGPLGIVDSPERQFTSCESGRQWRWRGKPAEYPPEETPTACRRRGVNVTSRSALVCALERINDPRPVRLLSLGEWDTLEVRRNRTWRRHVPDRPRDRRE